MDGVVKFKKKMKAKPIVPTNEPRKTLNVLDLSSQMIAPEAMAAVAEMLEHDDIAKYDKLKISDNLIKCSGARMLAKMLHVNRYLSVLDLEWNGIGDRGAKHLAKAFAVNDLITNVNLQWNAIGDEGGIALANALKSERCRISELKLYGNSLGDAASKALTEALPQKVTSCKVDVTFNMIQEDGRKEIQQFNDKAHPLMKHMVKVPPARKTVAYMRAKTNWRRMIMPVLWSIRMKPEIRKKPQKIKQYLTAEGQQMKGSMQTIKDDPNEAAAEDDLIAEATAAAHGHKEKHAPSMFHRYHPDKEAADAMEIMRQLNHIHKDPEVVKAAAKSTKSKVAKRDVT